METCVQTWDGHTFWKALLDECASFPALVEPLKKVFADYEPYTVDHRLERFRNVGSCFFDPWHAYLHAEIAYMAAAKEKTHFRHGCADLYQIAFPLRW